MNKNCRVLQLPPQRGDWNVAAEAVLLEHAEQKLTFAFTDWEPTVSVGNSQSAALDVNLDFCGEKNIKVVRRLSGGQAVYLDKNYIVFDIFGPRSFFPRDLSYLRKQPCDSIVRVLRRFGVPASFHKPDNVVCLSPRKRTLGNSGQVIKAKTVSVQASIRYDLPEDSFAVMLEALKTNGKGIAGFSREIRNVLSSVREFTSSPKDDIKSLLLGELLSAYNCKSFYRDSLTVEEEVKIERARQELIEPRLQDEEHYASRGVCYFYLNGSCIVPEIANFLPEVRPSTVADSTIS